MSERGINHRPGRANRPLIPVPPLLAASAVGIVLSVAACGSSGSKTATAPTVSTTAPDVPGPEVVTAHDTKYGTFLTDDRGFALYVYTADEPGGAGCRGACLHYWPPLLLPAGSTTPTGGAGVSGLGTFSRAGRLQVTYEGLPLYTYLSDARAGQVTGQNSVDSSGTWILATVPPPHLPAPSTSSPTSSPAATQAPPSAASAGTAVQPSVTRPSVVVVPYSRPPVTATVPAKPPGTPAPPTTPPAPPASPPTTAPVGTPTY